MLLWWATNTQTVRSGGSPGTGSRRRKRLVRVSERMHSPAVWSEVTAGHGQREERGRTVFGKELLHEFHHVEAEVQRSRETLWISIHLTNDLETKTQKTNE